MLLDGNPQAKATIKGKIDQPVAVLQDEETGSSAEAMALMLRPGERFRSFGTPTVSSASANEDVQFLTVDRCCSRRRWTSIAPDEAVSPDQAPSAAAAWLASRCG